MEKASKTLQEANHLLALGYVNNAVNRIYYACFYAITALLLQKDIKPKSHSGVRQMFGLHFIETGKLPRDTGRFFSDLFDKRFASDYEDFFELKKEIAEELFVNAKKLIETIKAMLPFTTGIKCVISGLA